MTHGHGGVLTDGAYRVFHVRGSFGFSEQGGKAGGCGIPNSATAVSATVNALYSSVDIRYGAYLLGFPAGGALPTANFMTYKQGGSSANPTLRLRAGAEPSLMIRSVGGTTDVAIDVFGYYAPPIAGTFTVGRGSTSTKIVAATSRILGIVWYVPGAIEVFVDRDISYCSPSVSSPRAVSFVTAFTRTFDPTLPSNAVVLYGEDTDLHPIALQDLSLTIHC